MFYPDEQNKEQETDLNGQPMASDDISPAGGDVIETAVKEKNVKRMTFMLIFAITLAIAVIWFMNKKNTPAAADAAVSDQQLQIETAIAKLTGIRKETMGSMDEMVKKFYEFADFSQVSPAQLAGNPFERSLNLPAITAQTDNTADSAIDVDTKLQLKSILESGSGNCCMINDFLLHKGDRIAGFEVVEIDSESVRLKAANSEITLRLNAK